MRVLSGRFLLGAAASLTLMSSGALAADFPVKAKAPAVQYVKICSLYGAGFYYIPGTDTCLKIGGHLRVDFFGGAPSGGVTESVDYNVNYDDQRQRYFHTRTRAYATFDARAQTPLGTLRSYFLTGATIDGTSDGSDSTSQPSAYMIRAFIQLAGFTWGLADSIFDAYSITPIHLNYVAATNGSIGASGIWQWRYTAQFGNGFSASIAVEEPRVRVKPISGATHRGARWPDILAQIRASGSWGRVQAAVAVKDATTTVAPFTSTISNTGWAAMVGGLLRVPGSRDNFGFQFAYAKGATDYVTGNANAAAATGIFNLTKGGRDTVGLITSGVLTAPTTVELVTAWGVEAGYEHHWTNQLKTSIAGGYVKIDYSGTQTLAFCGAAAAALGCNPDTSFWNIGSRTQWSPVANFSLALDVMYTHINTARSGVFNAAGQEIGPRLFPLADANVWTYLVRVRRDFWP